MLSRAAIQRKCAFTYMNAVFRKNLTEALAGDANDEDTALDPGGAFSAVTGTALSRRTIVTWTFGRERPPAGRPRGEEGGSHLTPHCRSARLRQRRRLRHRRHRAPPAVTLQFADW